MINPFLHTPSRGILPDNHIDFLLILTDLNFFLISATLGIAQTSLALLSLARDFYAEGV